MPDRRHLEFDRIEAIMPEVDRLLAGHVTVGRWSLGAICDHLTRTVDLMLALEPADSAPTREQRVRHRLFFRSLGFPEDQVPPSDDQRPDLDADPLESSAALRRSLAQLQAHSGLQPAHPILGPLTRGEWLTFHARHAAHHLSFALPT